MTRPTLLAAGSAVEPTVADALVFVSPDGNDSRSGLSWGSAFRTLNAAVAAVATNGKIHLAPGSFAYTSVQTISKPVTIDGSGIGVTTLLFTGSNYDCVSVTAAGVEIRDMTIDARSVTGAGVCLNVTGVAFTGRRLSPRGHSGAVISGPAVGSKWFECDRQITITATDCIVANCNPSFDPASGAGRIAVIGPGAHRAQVVGNRYGNTAADNTTAAGIEIQASDDVQIVDNFIDGSPWHGIWFNEVNGISNNAHVIGNTVLNSGRNRGDGNGTVSCIQLNAVQDGLCASNKLRNPPGYGIFAGGASGFTVTGTKIIGNKVVASGGDPGIAIRACEKFRVESNEVVNATYGITLGEAPGDAPVNRSQILNNVIQDAPWAAIRVRGSCNNEFDGNTFIDTGWDATTTGWAAAVIYLEDDGGTNALALAGGGSVGNRIGARNRIKRTVKPVTSAVLSIPRYFVRADGPNGTHPGAKTRGNVVEYPPGGYASLARGVVPSTAVPAVMQHQNKMGAGGFEVGVPASIQAASEQILSLDSGGSGGTADATNKVEGAASWRMSAAASATSAVQFSLPAAFLTGGASALDLMPDDAVFEIAVLVEAANPNLSSLRPVRFAQGSGDDTNVIHGNATMTSGYIEAAGTWQILRVRKGDMGLNGTATWSNVNWFRPQIVASAGGALGVLFDDLRVLRTG